MYKLITFLEDVNPSLEDTLLKLDQRVKEFFDGCNVEEMAINNIYIPQECPTAILRYITYKLK